METSLSYPPLLLGRFINESQAKIGEDDFKDLIIEPDGVVGLTGKSSALTISANMGERLSASIIPNLLKYPGSVVVIDSSGEAYTATAKARQEMGQTVVRLDPFRIVDQETDSLNPIDLLEDLDKSSFDRTCQDIAALVPGFHAFADILDGDAFGLLSGVIGYIAAVPEKNKFSDIYDTFHSDDVVYNLAVVLDTIGGKISKMSYSEISSWLQKSDIERSQILSALTIKIKAFSDQAVRKAFSQSTVSPKEILEGKSVSVYLMIPPEKIPTHYSLLSIWIGTLLYCARDRRFRAEIPMLFLLDETATFSPLSQMQAAITSPVANKLRIWTFWQDVFQIRRYCPGSWLFENSGVIQAFGRKDFDAANELAAALGIKPEIVHSITSYEQIVSIKGLTHKFNKFDYRTDPLFKGRFD